MKCKTCGFETTEGLAACPNCGAPGKAEAKPWNKRLTGCFTLAAAGLVSVLSLLSILILFSELNDVSTSKPHLVDLVKRVQVQVFTQSGFLSIMLAFSLSAIFRKTASRLIPAVPLLALIAMLVLLFTVVEGPLYGGGYLVLYFFYMLMMIASLALAVTGLIRR
jgi:hypothetical protein